MTYHTEQMDYSPRSANAPGAGVADPVEDRLVAHSLESSDHPEPFWDYFHIWRTR